MPRPGIEPGPFPWERRRERVGGWRKPLAAAAKLPVYKSYVENSYGFLFCVFIQVTIERVKAVMEKMAEDECLSVGKSEFLQGLQAEPGNKGILFMLFTGVNNSLCFFCFFF